VEAYIAVSSFIGTFFVSIFVLTAVFKISWSGE